MIKWRRIEDHPDTETRYSYLDNYHLDKYRLGAENSHSGTTRMVMREREVIPPGRWLFRWKDGSIEACSTDEAFPVGVWPGRMAWRPTHWAEFNEPETGGENE